MRGISRLEEKCRAISSSRSSPGSSPGQRRSISGITDRDSVAGVLGNSTDSPGEAGVLGNRKTPIFEKFCTYWSPGLAYGSPEQA